MPRPISERAVVLTGGSSGIGRATARELGRHGAAVVLAARNRGPLEEAAHEVERHGGSALPVVTDVAQWEQVAHLAQAAVQRYGRIDTWINNAAVIEYAGVDQTTPQEAEQIVRINLLGSIHGCMAALPHLKRQRSGHLINVASVVGVYGAPYMAVYSASKHGVRGFTEALRRELQLEESPIEVSLILPGSTNTPLF